jgi:hypothetical protein
VDADPDPNPTFRFYGDPDPTFHFNADQDPDPDPHLLENMIFLYFYSQQCHFTMFYFSRQVS